MKQKNTIARAIYQAHKNQTPIRANIRLKKSGHFSSIEGVVQSVRVSMDGDPYIVIKPKNKKHHIQTVILSNVMFVHEE